ncbi:hypothetical protein FXO38_36019 [Capsicum annuum]|nr:hypothetical protein FXO38_36019 [Capsicum annuum]KAF3663389.1 hypothetical protein FXO37_12008 [Capsicum annuum]
MFQNKEEDVKKPKRKGSNKRGHQYGKERYECNQKTSTRDKEVTTENKFDALEDQTSGKNVTNNAEVVEADKLETKEQEEGAKDKVDMLIQNEHSGENHSTNKQDETYIVNRSKEDNQQYDMGDDDVQLAVNSKVNKNTDKTTMEIQHNAGKVISCEDAIKSVKESTSSPQSTNKSQQEVVDKKQENVIPKLMSLFGK